MTTPQVFGQDCNGTSGSKPLVLTIPGLNGSGPDHWQSRWERERDDCARVEQANWSDPDPFDWCFRLHQAINGAPGPVVLVAHSLGTMLVAQWSSIFANQFDDKVLGALLVAPCDLERPGIPTALARFLPIPGQPLPFRSVVVASSNDPYATLERVQCFTNLWGSAFVDAGAAGHINADSGLGSWSFGQVLLDDLLRSSVGNTERYRIAASLRADQLQSRHRSRLTDPCRDKVQNNGGLQ